MWLSQLNFLGLKKECLFFLSSAQVDNSLPWNTSSVWKSCFWVEPFWRLYLVAVFLQRYCWSLIQNCRSCSWPGPQQQDCEETETWARVILARTFAVESTRWTFPSRWWHPTQSAEPRRVISPPQSNMNLNIRSLPDVLPWNKGLELNNRVLLHTDDWNLHMK